MAEAKAEEEKTEEGPVFSVAVDEEVVGKEGAKEEQEEGVEQGMEVEERPLPVPGQEEGHEGRLWGSKQNPLFFDLQYFNSSPRTVDDITSVGSRIPCIPPLPPRW